MWFDFKIKASYLQTVTGDGDLALQAMVRDPGEEERGEGDNTASSAYAEEGGGDGDDDRDSYGDYYDEIR